MTHDRSPRPRWTTIAIAVGGMLVVAVVIVVVLGSGIIGRPTAADPDTTASPSVSEARQPSAEETPEPSEEPSLAYDLPAGVLPPSAIVVVNEPMDLREAALDDATIVASVEAGSRMRIYGALIVDGRRWYTLTSLDESDRRYGYVALDPADDAVSLEPVDCPTGDPTIASLAPLNAWGRLACNGDREIVLTGHEVVGFGGFAPGVYSPDWLHGFLGAFAIADPDGPSNYIFVRVAPDGPDITRPQPSTEVGDALLRVTGHFNDAASTTCSTTELPIGPAVTTVTADLEPIASELMCRGEFVITEFEVVDEGSGEAPSLAALEIGSVVAPVIEGVTLREEAGTGGRRIGTLEAGTQNVVIDGPVEADGFAWYRIAATGLPPASGCIDPVITEPLGCPIWDGWAAAGNPADGSAWFVAVDVDCPDPTSDVGRFLGLPHRLPLACYGSGELAFTAFYPVPDDAGGGAPCRADDSIAWLYCFDVGSAEVWQTEEYTGAAERIFVDPDSGVTLPEPGQWLRISGAYDHPDSAACAAANQDVGTFDRDDVAVLNCRINFVVSGVEVTSAP